MISIMEAELIWYDRRDYYLEQRFRARDADGDLQQSVRTESVPETFFV